MTEPGTAVARGVLRRVERLVADLRAAGVPVGLAEVVDATAAVAAVDLARRDEVRVALLATLVKREQDLALFDVLFEAWFPASHRRPDERRPLRERLVGAVAEGDTERLDELAREAADAAAAAGGDPRGRYQRLVRQLEVGAVAQEALRSARAAGRSQPPGSAVAAVDRFLRALRNELLARRRREQTDGDVAALVLRPADVAIVGASALELQELRAAVRPLARRLAARLHDAHRDRRGALDVRRTMRNSLSAGGVPLDTAWRRRRPHRPDLWLLCDVSGSVAEFARFTIGLVTAAHDEIPRLRPFVFVDDVVDLSTTLDDRTHDVDAFALVGAAAVGLAGRRSDWGQALRAFELRHAAALGPRSTIVITGDARSHGADPGADVVERLSRKACSVSLLVPEPRARWHTGDSALGAYEAAGARVHEARTLGQLADALEAVVRRATSG